MALPGLEESAAAEAITAAAPDCRVIDVEDRPAALGELTRRLAEANVNVDLACTTFTGGKIVIAADDVGGARSVLRAWGGYGLSRAGWR